MAFVVGTLEDLEDSLVEDRVVTVDSLNEIKPLVNSSFQTLIETFSPLKYEDVDNTKLTTDRDDVLLYSMFMYEFTLTKKQLKNAEKDRNPIRRRIYESITGNELNLTNDQVNF